jgi:hypothetical protein
MAIVGLIDEIPEMIRSYHEKNRARLALSLDIPMEGFKRTHVVSYESLNVSLTDELVRRCYDEGMISEDRERVLVMGGWIRIVGGERRVSDALGDRPVQRETKERQGGGAKRQAPLTGPRRAAFTRRGKDDT